ncbi:MULTISPECIES: hypothetical protein, partial [Enterococcus]|uniref:hypothetical protein n=1 Tax=Enterococcus TaxID=1350 RepID=UPI001C401473
SFLIGLKAYFNQLMAADQSPAVFFCYKLFCLAETRREFFSKAASGRLSFFIFVLGVKYL